MSFQPLHVLTGRVLSRLRGVAADNRNMRIVAVTIIGQDDRASSYKVVGAASPEQVLNAGRALLRWSVDNMPDGPGLPGKARTLTLSRLLDQLDQLESLDHTREEDAR